MPFTQPDPQAPFVLVVDDEADIASYLSLRLRHGGYNAKGFDSCLAALAELDTRPYDLIISDWTMPCMSGLELIDEARTRHPNLKAVLLTGHEEMEHKDLHEHGVVAILIKPYEFSDLLKILRDSFPR